MSLSESRESSSRISCNQINSVNIPGKPGTSEEILKTGQKEPGSGKKREICWTRNKFLVKNVSVDMDLTVQVTAV